MAVVSVHRVLQVVRDFEFAGGASLGLVAWELTLDEADVVAAWDRARALELIKPGKYDEPHDEQLWRLSSRGWAELDVDPGADSHRVTILDRLAILDRIDDPGLDAIVRIGSFLTDGSAVAVHIFDDRYQRRIAAVNAPLGAHPAHDAMCRVVVDSGQPIVLEDAVDDERFASISWVGGDEPVRFYASLPLRTSDDGTVVGTLCAFDTVSRELSGDQLALFEQLAQQAVAHIEYARLAIDLAHLATHDALTGTANRLLLPDRLEQALARRQRFGGEVLLVLLDVDGFTAFNERHGRAAGDAVLREVASRLGSTVHAGDTVARIGDNEFALVIELGGDAAVASDEMLARVRQAVSAPVVHGDRELAIAVAFGSAVAVDGEDAGALLASARAELTGDG
jgi:diguanylate cyclase (GGDEF)-like protein